MSDDYKWYVVQTKPRNEFRAERELSNQGYASYLPEIQTRCLRRERERTVTEPLFPRYLFIQLSLVRSDWHPIRSTRGVTGLVTFGDGDPLPVSDHVVDTIRDNCCELAVQPRFTLGDRVRVMPSEIQQPQATEFWGRLASMDGEGRAVVLLSLLGREHEIQVATDRLSLA